MSNLHINGSRFIFKDAQGERVLLDCANWLANKSRVSMGRLPGEKHSIISEILLEQISKQKDEEADLAFPFGVLDVLLVSRLIRSAEPVRLLEYGSGQGKLSAHLAELLGVFHEKSSLVCFYDTIELEWMEQISYVKHLPKLSLLAGDFGNSGLQENTFDIAVINGLADFAQPADVIRDVLALVKKDGAVLCYSADTPLLESTFKLFFETREEYEITPSSSVMIAEAAQCSWQEKSPPDLAGTIQKDLAKAAEMPAGNELGHEACTQMLEQLQKDLRAAVEQGETALKIQLLAQKEQLLDSLIANCGS